jgi:hypothetical protein
MNFIPGMRVKVTGRCLDCKKDETCYGLTGTIEAVKEVCADIKFPITVRWDDKKIKGLGRTHCTLLESWLEPLFTRELL